MYVIVWNVFRYLNDIVSKTLTLCIFLLILYGIYRVRGMVVNFTYIFKYSPSRLIRRKLQIIPIQCKSKWFWKKIFFLNRLITGFIGYKFVQINSLYYVLIVWSVNALKSPLKFNIVGSINN